MANTKSLIAKFINFSLTTTLNPVPFFILPLPEKISFAQWGMTFMPGVIKLMPGMMLEVLLVSIITGKTAHNTPECFDLARH